jgi:hypothetical protein
MILTHASKERLHLVKYHTVSGMTVWNLGLLHIPETSETFKAFDDVYYFMRFVLYNKRCGIYKKTFVLHSNNYEIVEDED